MSFRDSLAAEKTLSTVHCSFDEYLLLSGKSQLLEEKARLMKNPILKALSLIIFILNGKHT